MEISGIPFYNLMWAYPNYYYPTQAYCLTPVVAFESDPAPLIPESRCNDAAIEKPEPKPRVRQNRKKEKKNVRNIIPNISRKLINYLCSAKSGNVIRKIKPLVSVLELESFYEFAKKLKSSMSFYIGNKDLMRIWFGEGGLRKPQEEENYRLMRLLSKLYLQDECANSIILSRRIKPSLKVDHLKYRRKILRLLYSQGSSSANE